MIICSIIRKVGRKCLLAQHRRSERNVQQNRTFRGLLGTTFSPPTEDPFGNSRITPLTCFLTREDARNMTKEHRKRTPSKPSGLIASILNRNSPQPPTDAEYTAGHARKRIGLAGDPVIRLETPKRRFQRIARRAAAAAQLAPLPGPGEEVVLIMTGTFHGWDIVTAIAELAAPVTIAHLHIATLSFNQAQTHELADLLDAGTVAAVTMVVSDMFYQKDRPTYELLANELTARGHVIARPRNHAKLLCFALADGRRLCAHGSLNLRRCNSYEQIAISSDPALYDFFVAFIEEAAGESP